MPLLDPRLMTLQPTAVRTPTFATYASMTSPLVTAKSAFMESNQASVAAPITAAMISRMGVSAPEAPTPVAAPLPSASLVKSQNTLATYTMAKFMDAVTTAPEKTAEPETVEGETFWQMRRTGTNPPAEDGAINELLAATQKQDPITLMNATPKVMTNPEIFQASLVQERKVGAGDAYGQGTITENTATQAATSAPSLLTVQKIVSAQKDMDHEALVQLAARSVEQQASVIKPLIPPVKSVALLQAQQNAVTTASADRSATQELLIGQKGVRYMTAALEAGRPPVMPDPVAPVMPDYPTVPSYYPEAGVSLLAPGSSMMQNVTSASMM